MANVGKNIRNLREQKKLTQDELAARLFVSRQTVSNYETGKSNPDIDMLVRIAEILHTDVNILIFGIPTSPHRKKEVLRLLIYLTFTILTGTAVALLTPFAVKWLADYFDFSPSLIVTALFRPAFYLFLGLFLMQLCFFLLHARLKPSAKTHAAYLILLSFIMLYFLLLLPFFADSIYYSIQIYRLDVQKTAFSSSDIVHLMPDGYRQACPYVALSLRKPLYLFLPLGMALRAVKPDTGIFTLCRRKNPDTPQ